jgi:hypothetical protein
MFTFCFAQKPKSKDEWAIIADKKSHRMKMLRRRELPSNKDVKNYAFLFFKDELVSL